MSGSAKPSASRNCRASRRAATAGRTAENSVLGGPGRVEAGRRAGGAVLEPDDGLPPGRTRLIARVPRLSPQRLVLVEEPVEATDPLIGLGRKERARDPGYDSLRSQ